MHIFGVNTKDDSFVLKIIQPGLLGLMDGSVSTLAPIFAVAFATRNPHITFIVGLSATAGAGISMAFAEALSDNGVLTGRGHPFLRGGVTGLMTFLGGFFHTIPFLIHDINIALYAAYGVVGLELILIAFIRRYYMRMNFMLSIIQVVIGGGLVFLAGVLLGHA
jgi:VIT1/CCC1 family predicted Fe2+/Mn2+ transporter